MSTSIENQIAEFFTAERAAHGVIDTIPKLDAFIAAKNKRLGIPHVSLIAPKIETYLAASEALEEALTAPEYRPSAYDIVLAISHRYCVDYGTAKAWLIELDFDFSEAPV